MLKFAIPLVIAAALLVSGCGRKDEPPPAPSPPAPVQQQGAATTPGSVPDRPAPDTAKESVTEYPKPGQANDHSSPEFKGGGKPAQ